MESASLSTPISAPQFRGFRRASEISIASQVSGMADSYTASNIANSKCFTPSETSTRCRTALGATHRAGAAHLLSVCLGFYFPLTTKSWNDSAFARFCHSRCHALSRAPEELLTYSVMTQGPPLRYVCWTVLVINGSQTIVVASSEHHLAAGCGEGSSKG